MKILKDKRMRKLSRQRMIIGESRAVRYLILTLARKHRTMPSMIRYVLE